MTQQRSEQLVLDLSDDGFSGPTARGLFVSIQEARGNKDLRDRRLSHGVMSLLMQRGAITFDDYTTLAAAKNERRSSFTASSHATIHEEIPESMTAPGVPVSDEGFNDINARILARLPPASEREFDWAERASGEYKDRD